MEKQWVPLSHPGKRILKGQWWRRLRPRAPIPLQQYPGFQPAAYRPQHITSTPADLLVMRWTSFLPSLALALPILPLGLLAEQYCADGASRRQRRNKQTADGAGWLGRCDLIFGPAQVMLHFLVALFNPHPQAVQPDNLFQGGRSRVLRRAAVCSGLCLIPPERICSHLFEMLFEQLNSLSVSTAAQGVK